MGARETIQARIDAQQRYDAIEYGRKTLQEMGGRSYGVSAEWGAGDWAIAQWEAAKAAAGFYGEQLDGSADNWRLAKAKRAAATDLLAAKEAEKAIGTKRQLRLALAA